MFSKHVYNILYKEYIVYISQKNKTTKLLKIEYKKPKKLIILTSKILRSILDNA